MDQAWWWLSIRYHRLLVSFCVANSIVHNNLNNDEWRHVNPSANSICVTWLNEYLVAAFALMLSEQREQAEPPQRKLSKRTASPRFCSVRFGAVHFAPGNRALSTFALRPG
ncbi:hypothetical protein [Antarcticimicrobium sediminis]|uniref:Uncharacterized protein n=1 Tax=Antarcticimicrobium sediminis TaxID=2546227 RepID=A0A4R5EVC7_9RHOB|nr:hypothetical protein [Antarcticimicrobium sediminis]TDE38928.1 hypothetical protein E1B25_07870 [Antarcticimicrobium sediminis]